MSSGPLSFELWSSQLDYISSCKSLKVRLILNTHDFFIEIKITIGKSTDKTQFLFLKNNKKNINKPKTTLKF